MPLHSVPVPKSRNSARSAACGAPALYRSSASCTGTSSGFAGFPVQLPMGSVFGAMKLLIFFAFSMGPTPGRLFELSMLSPPPRMLPGGAPPVLQGLFDTGPGMKTGERRMDADFPPGTIPLDGGRQVSCRPGAPSESDAPYRRFDGFQADSSVPRTGAANTGSIFL